MFHRCVACVESGVSYLSSKFGSITEAPDGLRFISCEKKKHRCSVQKLLQYEVGRRRVSLFKMHMA
uniref:Uncharacterized protein n=1 Tax=Brassica oleracea TaxID=3712 RepID=A0A3P6GDE2_BRAOL|nr:unnamed protein product [Brassica oleracea]